MVRFRSCDALAVRCALGNFVAPGGRAFSVLTRASVSVYLFSSARMEEGTFVPYSDKELWEVLIAAKARVHPWIRLNRVVRAGVLSHCSARTIDAAKLRRQSAHLRAHVLQRCR